MDPKMKTALAVVVGIVIGMTLLGAAVALPAAFHSVALRANAVDEYGYGMMGQRPGAIDGPWTMGPRGQAPRWDDGAGVCPNDGRGYRGQGTIDPRDGGRGMMGPRGGSPYGPQDGTGICPNGGTCPNISDVPATES